MHIVKYSNRKLYHKEEAVYITLNQLVNYVRAGETVKITCFTTKNDITTDVLRTCLPKVPTSPEAIMAFIRQ